MALFSRKGAPARQQSQAIAEFWGWWRSAGAADTAAALGDGKPERMVDELSGRVKAIHQDLGWELGPGELASEHALIVTSQGDPSVRGVARRWLLAAPGSDPVWEYADARRPMADVQGAQLTLGDVMIDLASAQAGARIHGAALNVTVYHPRFEALPDEQRTIAAFLLLDWALGEADVETWVGNVQIATVAPLDPVPLVGLRAVTRQLREQFTDADGEPAWAMLQGTTPDGSPVLVSTLIPLRGAVAPNLDSHVAVAVPYTDRTEQGLPGPAALAALGEFEQHLTGRLGNSGRLVAHETRGGTRILHFYVDGATPAAEQLRAAIGGWQQGRVRIESASDPGWDRVRHLRG